jgi:hypothetical protein
MVLNNTVGICTQRYVLYGRPAQSALLGRGHARFMRPRGGSRGFSGCAGPDRPRSVTALYGPCNGWKGLSINPAQVREIPAPVFGNLDAHQFKRLCRHNVRRTYQRLVQVQIARCDALLLVADKARDGAVCMAEVSSE